MPVYVIVSDVGVTVAPAGDGAAAVFTASDHPDKLAAVLALLPGLSEAGLNAVVFAIDRIDAERMQATYERRRAAARELVERKPETVAQAQAAAEAVARVALAADAPVIVTDDDEDDLGDTELFVEKR
jgi:ABC-type uncharacterized transport system substrate-binding protein